MRMDTCMATVGYTGTPPLRRGAGGGRHTYSTKRGGEALDSERLAASQKTRVLVPPPLPGCVAQCVRALA